MSTNWLDQISIIDVWERLGGGPIHDGSVVVWRRGDDSPNIESNLNVWFDTRGVGGVVDLVSTVLRCDQQTALQWLREQRFDGAPAKMASVDRPGTEIQADLWQMAEEICSWRSGCIFHLEELEEAVEVDFWRGRATYEELEDVRRDLFLMKTDAKEVVDAFRFCRAESPIMAAVEIQLGRPPGKWGTKKFMAAIVRLLSCDSGSQSLSDSPASGPANKGPKP